MRTIYRAEFYIQAELVFGTEEYYPLPTYKIDQTITIHGTNYVITGLLNNIEQEDRGEEFIVWSHRYSLLKNYGQTYNKK